MHALFPRSQDGSVVTVGVKCLRHAEMLVPVVTLSWQCTGSDRAFILIRRLGEPGWKFGVLEPLWPTRQVRALRFLS